MAAAVVEYSGWLLVEENGRMEYRMRDPALKAGQRAIRVRVSVPKSIFRVPSMEAIIKVAPDQSPDRLTAEVVGSIQQHVRAATGIEVVLSLVRDGAEDQSA